MILSLMVTVNAMLHNFYKYSNVLKRSCQRSSQILAIDQAPIVLINSLLVLIK